VEAEDASAARLRVEDLREPGLDARRLGGEREGARRSADVPRNALEVSVEPSGLASTTASGFRSTNSR
jgi:hypothetical protein